MILDNDFNWEPWLKMLAVMSIFLFGIVGVAIAADDFAEVHRYVGIAICIAVAVASFYYSNEYPSYSEVRYSLFD